jgi:hypothetical protein
MSVEYEWNFDADSSSEEPAPANHRARARWRTRLLVAATVVLVGALGYYLVWRLRRTSIADAAANVLSAVRMEQRALEAGDGALFVGLQDEEDTVWVEAQRGRLSEGAALPAPAPGLVATGVLTVEKPTILGDRAEVPLVRLAGPPGGPQFPFRSVSFYRLLPDGRWVHTAPDPAYARRPLAWVGPRNELVGHIVQTDLFEQLAPDLELTAAAFCELFSCTPELRFRLVLTGTLSAESLPAEVLPAPHVAGAPIGGDAMVVWKRAMENHLVELMITQVAGNRSGKFLTDALHAQVKTYLGVGQPHQADPARLAEALSTGQLPTLEDLWSEPTPDGDRGLAEDAAAVLVRYIEQEYGREGVVALLSGASHAPDAVSLFAIAFGSEAGLIEQRWIEYVAKEVVPEAALPFGTT